MTTPARVAAAAVIGVLAIGGAFFLASGPSGPSARRSRPRAISRQLHRPVATVGAPQPRSTTRACRPDPATSTSAMRSRWLGDAPSTEPHPERRRFYFMDPATMTGRTTAGGVPAEPADDGQDGGRCLKGSARRSSSRTSRTEPGCTKRTWTAPAFDRIPITCDCELLYPDYDPTATKVVYVPGRRRHRAGWRSVITRARPRSSSRRSVPRATRSGSSPPGRRMGRLSPSTASPGGREAPTVVVVGTIHYGERRLFQRPALLDVARATFTTCPSQSLSSRVT